MYVERGSDL